MEHVLKKKIIERWVLKRKVLYTTTYTIIYLIQKTYIGTFQRLFFKFGFRKHRTCRYYLNYHKHEVPN